MKATKIASNATEGKHFFTWVEMKERLKTLYELDKPIHVQYWSWLKKLGHGDLGVSFASDHRPVTAKILERLPITILLEFLSLLIIIAIAIPIGVLSAVYQDSLFDKITGKNDFYVTCVWKEF